MPSSDEQSARESFDVGLVATIRCALALAGAIIFTLDLLTHTQHPEVSDLVPALYVTYSVILYMVARWRRPILPNRVEPWLDISWAVALMVFIRSERGGLFLAFAVFALLIAAFQWGLRLRLRTALGSALLFACVGAVVSFARPELDLRDIFVGLTALVALGYLITAFGGRELTVKGRLAFMKEVTRLSNPRFGLDRTIGMFMERLRAFHDADTCILVMSDLGASSHHLRRVDRRDPERGVHTEPLPEELSRILLALPAEQAVLHAGLSRVHWWQWRKREYTYDMMQGQHLETNQQMNELLAATIGAEAFMTVPLPYHRQAIGRLYLTRQHPFNPSDVHFLLQVIEHIVPAIQHIRLVDQLASRAAEVERRRIAHDLHDSVIQPYIWLCIGLGAIQQKIAAGGADVLDDLQRLRDLTNSKINELRRYTRGLKEKGDHVGALLPAVRRFAENFSEATGIPIQIEASADLYLNDQLAAEVFQMVAEGLSNILRHTQATRACITIAQGNDHCTVQIANDGAAPALFTPLSLTERASALGGTVRVERQADETTVVVIDVPL
jgi:signal transduction histidine kinase